MRNLKDPTQTELFNPYSTVFKDANFNELNRSWQGVFRHVILELLPAREIGKHFTRDMGRPTKELYSIAGLLFLLEAMNWTKEEALTAYRYHMDVHYALNLSPSAQQLGMRTLERYIALFNEDELAAKVMNDVTSRLVKLLELDVSKQRLDSTHIYSNMASMGRTRLMRTAIKRFLAQVIRHDESSYRLLPEELTERYFKNEFKVFAHIKNDEKKLNVLRQKTAEDLNFVINFFADDETHTNRTTYKNMVTIFHQQCEIKTTTGDDSGDSGDSSGGGQEIVEVRKKTGGNIIVNPSDPDATFDGHKGEGYQVQLCETCSDENDVQLIVDAEVQTAVESDSAFLETALENLESKQLSPKQLLADTAYCTDDNVQTAMQKNISLTGPAPGKYRTKSNKKMNLSYFKFDSEKLIITRCPANRKPLISKQFCSGMNNSGIPDKLLTVMDGEKCFKCNLNEKCPGKFSGTTGVCAPFTFRIHMELKSLRLYKRREHEQTDEFRTIYKKRSGIEGTNSGLKQKTGMGRLRVRHKKRVTMAVLLKVSGWNMMRAAVSEKMHIYVKTRALKAGLAFLRAVFSIFPLNFRLNPLKFRPSAT